jgi:hypothetical protein
MLTLSNIARFRRYLWNPAGKIFRNLTAKPAHAQ